MVKAYKYIFSSIYFFYKARGDSAPHIFSWGIVSLFMGLILLTFNSIITYVFYPYSLMNSYNTIVIVFILLIINYYMIWYKEKYKKIIKEYEKMNEEKNGFKYLWILYFVFSLIVTFIISSFPRQLFLE